jgi:hypothetical protein
LWESRAICATGGYTYFFFFGQVKKRVQFLLFKNKTCWFCRADVLDFWMAAARWAAGGLHILIFQRLNLFLAGPDRRRCNSSEDCVIPPKTAHFLRQAQALRRTTAVYNLVCGRGTALKRFLAALALYIMLFFIIFFRGH